MTLHQMRAFVLIVFTLVVGLLTKLTNLNPSETFGYAAFLIASLSWVDVRYVAFFLGKLTDSKEAADVRKT